MVALAECGNCLMLLGDVGMLYELFRAKWVISCPHLSVEKRHIKCAHLIFLLWSKGNIPLFASTGLNQRHCNNVWCYQSDLNTELPKWSRACINTNRREVTLALDYYFGDQPFLGKYLLCFKDNWQAGSESNAWPSDGLLHTLVSCEVYTNSLYYV